MSRPLNLATNAEINGIQGSHIEFLICAVANRMESPIFTNDKEFVHYQKVIPIRLC